MQQATTLRQFLSRTKRFSSPLAELKEALNESQETFNIKERRKWPPGTNRPQYLVALDLDHQEVREAEAGTSAPALRRQIDAIIGDCAARAAE